MSTATGPRERQHRPRRPDVPEISINGGMGGGVLHLPSGVVMEGLDLGWIDVPAIPEPESPTLTFSVSTGLGRLELSDIHLR